MWKILSLLVIEHVRQRPIRISLAVLGVAIGVSAWLAIRLANGEVFRAFEASVDGVVGTASIQVTGGESGLDEQILVQIRQHRAITAVNPVIRITGRGTSQSSQGGPVLIWGLDLLEYVSETPMMFPGMENRRRSMEALLEENSIFVGRKLAADWKLEVGDPLEILALGRTVQLVVQGIVTYRDPNHRHFDRLMIMDIAAVQGLFERQGRLDQINLVLEPGYSAPQVMQDLRAFLPAGVRVSRTKTRNRQVESMLNVFQFNLTVLSTVGLLVGLFLVYNTISFSVVQHRREIGILRTLGMSRRQVSTIFLTEAAGVGCIGGLVGCGLGLLMARLVTGLVSQSVTDLFASVTIGSIQLPWVMVLEGTCVGIGVSVLGAIRPSLDASGTTLVRALAPGDYEVDARIKETYWAWVAAAFFLLTGLMSLPKPIQGVPLFGYAAAFFLLLACTLLGPMAIRGLTWAAQRGMTPRWSVMGTLAVEQIGRTPGRNSVTLSALVIGLAILVGVGGMIRSFRSTVELWIDQTIMADLIVAPVSWLDNSGSREPEPGLPLELIEVIRTISGVSAIDPYRQIEVDRQEGTVMLVARDMLLHAGQSRYLFEKGHSTQILKQAVNEKGVIVSEVLAGRLGLKMGDDLELSTPKGATSFPVLGTFYDYASDGGKAVMDQSVYRRFWDDDRVSVFAVYIEPHANLQEVRRRIEDTIEPRSLIVTISHAELKKDILSIFDRTFRVTYVLEFIALSVALLGIVNTLVTAIVERQREIATFRAIGASTKQIQHMVFWEAGYLASLGALIGVGGGLALSVLLVKVINKQSFGWTIQHTISSMTLFEAVCVAGLAGILASYFPARWAAEQPIAEGLRYE